jgi:sugar lactone lactonase YvrE
VRTPWSHPATVIGLAAALIACQPAGRLAPAVPQKQPPPRATGVADAALAARLRTEGGSRVTAEGASLLGLDDATVIRLPPSGLVRVASGGAIIGVDAGTLVGVDAGTLVGVDAGTLVGVDAGTLVGVDAGTLTGRVELPTGLAGPRSRYRLASTTPAAGVRVYVRDAQGRFFIGADGRLVSAVTGKDGVVTFPGYKAARGLSLHVPLDAVEGVLRGFTGLRPRTQPAGVPVGVNPAATLLAGWVETQVLATQPDRGASLDRLTPDAAGQAEQAARQALARQAIDTPDWRPDKLATMADAASLQDGALAAALQEVRRIMTLAGVDGCKDGSPATQTALQQPVSIAAAADGTLYVAEAMTGVIRRLTPDGLASSLTGCNGETILYLSNLVATPTGLYGLSEPTRAVYRVSLDGRTVERVAGGGDQPPAEGVLATTMRLAEPTALAAGRDGTLLIADTPGGDGPRSLLLRLALDTGKVSVLPGLDTPGQSHWLEGLAEAPDGTRWALLRDPHSLWLQRPGQAWRKVPVKATLDIDQHTHLLALPDGSALVSLHNRRNPDSGRILRITADGETRFAGTDLPGLDERPVAALEAHLHGPSGLARLPDGTVLVTESISGLVRAIGPDGQVTVRAGTTVAPATRAMDAALNIPGGITLDPQGRVVLTEFGGNTVRRLDGNFLTLLAGGRPGRVPDGKQATSLLTPMAIAAAPEGYYVVETLPRHLRHLRRDGTVVTLAGGGEMSPREHPGVRLRALDARFSEVTSVVRAPDGQPVFAASVGEGRYQIYRVERDGMLTLLAGSLAPEAPKDEAREGLDARTCGFGMITGVAYDAAGNLYAAEPSAGVITRLDPAGKVTRYAGSGLARSVLQILNGEAQHEQDVPAQDATLLIPMGLACDAAGNLYVAEIGTRSISALGDVPGMKSDQVPPIAGRIRVITPDGRARTLAGVGSGRDDDAVRSPLGLAVSPEGRIFYVDNGTAQLKELRRAP